VEARPGNPRTHEELPVVIHGSAPAREFTPQTNAISRLADKEQSSMPIPPAQHAARPSAATHMPAVYVRGSDSVMRERKLLDGDLSFPLERLASHTRAPVNAPLEPPSQSAGNGRDPDATGDTEDLDFSLISHEVEE
jgi:hypothetical protein